MSLTLKKIGTVRTDFPTKFGLPRQSGLADALTGRIIMEPQYRRAEAFRGLEEYSHIWVLWEFSEAKRETWSATVKPPRLGGKVRMGVFATRSPFRPNPVGLSCLKLEKMELDQTFGPMLFVSGIDMMDGTPIYDIKPYLPHVDAQPLARGGFAEKVKDHCLTVEFPDEEFCKLPRDKQAGAIQFLSQDPRPPYHNHPEQIYKIAYAGYDIHFQVQENMLTVREVKLL